MTVNVVQGLVCQAIAILLVCEVIALLVKSDRDEGLVCQAIASLPRCIAVRTAGKNPPLVTKVLGYGTKFLVELSQALSVPSEW